MKILLGRKMGMTQIYDETGTAQAVTVIEAGPCVVTQIKTLERDGYPAMQIGYQTRKHITKPVAGHLKKSAQANLGVLRELRLPSAAEAESITLGQTIDVTSFAVGDLVTVVGTSKGKGYAGVVKRHGFAGGPGSHGSDFHRAPGAIGGRWPQRVTKGRRMAGHMGSERVTVKSLRVVRIDQASNLVALAGAVPGPKRSLVEIRG